MFQVNENDWFVEQSGIMLHTKQPIKIPFFKKEINVWFDLEQRKQLWTEKQLNSFLHFCEMDNSNFKNLEIKFEKCYLENYKSNRIKRFEFTDLYSSINWEKSHICIPTHYNTKDEFVIFLPETYWQIKDSKHYLELEILFTNQKIELTQEMKGISLWDERFLMGMRSEYFI